MSSLVSRVHLLFGDRKKLFIWEPVLAMNPGIPIALAAAPHRKFPKLYLLWAT